ncbi:MAG: GNAT family N-acetyltransferase [Eubacterium sp.]|nr:GNAT family N-acetyltransferase [Eubacterium sp.]
MNIEIKTDRLVLRPLSINDLDSVHTYASDNDNTRFMVWLPNDTKEETAQFLLGVTEEWKKAEPDFYEFAITLDGKQIGAISCALNEQRDEGEFGWIINKRYWKMGYATEAAFAIKDFAINKLKVKKLTANCDYRNTDSYRLMEKLGLKLESDNGTRTYHKTGETAREFVYSLSVK